MSSPPVSSLIERIVAAGKALEGGETGARESLVALNHALIAQLEMPCEFLQRTFWGEVSRPMVPVI